MIRQLDQQHVAAKDLRQTATVTLATSLVGSVIAVAGQAGTAKHPISVGFGITVVAIVFLIAGCVIALMLPTQLVTGFSASKLIDGYVEASPPSSLEDMYRDMALWGQRHYDKNDLTLSRGQLLLRIAVGLLLIEGVIIAVYALLT